MGPTDDVPRLLECGTAMSLCGRSHLAIRVYLHLFWGDGSEKPGFGRCGPGELADVLDSSRRAVVKALDELAAAGLIVWSESERLAYRPGFAKRFTPTLWTFWANWRDTISRLRDGLIRTQLLKDIEPEPSRRTDTRKVRQADTRADYLSVPSILSVSSIPSDHPSDDVPAEPEQPTLALTAPKNKAPKPPPPGLLLVTLWNDPDCPGRGIARLSRENVRLCNSIVQKTDEEDLRWLFDWARVHPYWSGNGRSTPTFSRILSVAGWDAFSKDIEKHANANAPAPGNELSIPGWADEDPRYNPALRKSP